MLKVEKLTDEAKAILRRIKREDLILINELVTSGNAGADKLGRVVDLRTNPKAQPLNYENYFMPIEKPKTTGKKQTLKTRKTKKEKTKNGS